MHKHFLCQGKGLFFFIPKLIDFIGQQKIV